MTFRPPFQERKSPWRAVLDVAFGRYPRFVWGGGLNPSVPVFHFHDVTAEYLDPYLRHLAERGYHTITSGAMTDLVRKGVHPGPDKVALCFDDAWASLWTVVAPLLQRYGMTAIAYAIPGRVAEAPAVRPQGAAPAGSPFATWPELKALAASGVVDVQAHTHAHAMVFCAPDITGFVAPGTDLPALSWPALALGATPQFADATMLGCPLYPTRSRMSDAWRWLDDPAGRARCLEHVAAQGGADYFRRPDWEAELRRLAGGGRRETADERTAAIRFELVHARDVLCARLGPQAIRQVCLPWAVCGRTAEAILPATGFTTAVADQIWGYRAVRAGDNPWRLMRLKHNYILRLPRAPGMHHKAAAQKPAA
jgi:hypothetical protein